MGIKSLLNKKNIQPRDLGHIGLERVTEPLNEAASIDDRIVSIPDPDEQVPQPVKKKGIVSVNGEDVKSDKERAA
jgi:hypothetical protein